MNRTNIERLFAIKNALEFQMAFAAMAKASKVVIDKEDASLFLYLLTKYIYLKIGMVRQND